MILKTRKGMIAGIILMLFFIASILSFTIFACDARLVRAAEAPEYKYEYPKVQELTLPSVLSDGMVLQQDKQVHIWGLTVSGKEVTASLLDAEGASLASGKATADADGRFDIYFDGQDASFAKYTVKVQDDTKEIVISDVLFGEVWLTGGQSNMELQLQYLIGGPDLIRAARADTKYENFRIFLEPTMPEGMTIESDFAYLPQFDIAGARWGYANNKDDLKIVSGLAYACAQQMFEGLNAGGKEVPVAIMNTAVGATSIEAWMSRTSIDETPEVVNWLKNIKKNYVSREAWNTTKVEKFNQMTALFNEKIAPIAGYPVKGLLWCQGDNNMGDQASADFYSVALPTMVEDWSLNWWKDEETFYCEFYQINAKEDNYQPDSIPMFVEGMSKAWSENREYMMQVPVYDIPLTWNYGPFEYKATAHPLDKIPIGQRGARIILGNVYGLYEESTPATYLEMEVQGNSVYVTFENAGKDGLHTKDDLPVRGFTICGEDRLFVAAEAEIVDKDTVRVWSDDVETPVAVTYGYTCFNGGCNLYNGIDMPVVMFRSDRDASNQYYHAKDWMWADSIELWIDNGVPPTDPDAASMRPVWQTNPISKNLGASVSSDDTAIKNKSVRMTYSRGGTYGFGVVGPANRTGKLNNMIFGQWYLYEGLEFNLMNNDAREKSVSVVIDTFSHGKYTLPFVGTYSASAALNDSDEWQTFEVALNCLIDENDYYVYDTQDILVDLAAFEIRVEDDAAGSVSVDELLLRPECSLDIAAENADSFTGEGAYANAGGTEVFTGLGGAVGRTVLTLGKTGTASAQYDAEGALLARVTLLARGGAYAKQVSGSIVASDGKTDVSAAVATFIGSDGFKYAQSAGAWYRFVKESGKYAAVPSAQLPDELTPVVFAEAYCDDAWTPLTGSLVSVSDAGAGYTEEVFEFSLPQGSSLVRVSFTSEWRELAENGNSGTLADRAHQVMLSGVTLLRAGSEGENAAPQIVLHADRESYTVGDTVMLSIAACDDRTAASELEVTVNLIVGGQKTALDSSSFVIGQNCTVEVIVKDGDGATQTAALQLTAQEKPSDSGDTQDPSDTESPADTDKKEEPTEGGSNAGLIAGLCIAGAAVIAAVAVILVKIRKGRKNV